MSWVTTDSTEDTERLAAEFAQRLGPGDIVLLEGKIGTGKTTFVRGACRSLGVTAPVTSPTFTIGQVYPLPPAAVTQGLSGISHLDLYRLVDPEAEEPEFIEEYATADRITFIEWPGGAPDLPPHRRVLKIQLQMGGSSESRRVLLP